DGADSERDVEEAAREQRALGDEEDEPEHVRVKRVEPERAVVDQLPSRDAQRPLDVVALVDDGANAVRARLHAQRHGEAGDGGEGQREALEAKHEGPTLRPVENSRASAAATDS